MKLFREKLIRFYDEKIKNDSGRGSDVSALTALWGEDLILGLLQHYWETSEKSEAKIVSYSCNGGRKSGYRLDAWILKEKDKKETLYQAEIKNWAVYSVGGRELKVDATIEQIENYRHFHWNDYFGSEQIPYKEVNKVLSEMKRPKGYEHLTSNPLLSFWFFISESSGKPYSTRRYVNGQVDVFSASAYLRTLTDETIDLKMPRAERRLKLVSDLSMRG